MASTNSGGDPSSASGQVVVGPDLNESRTPLDKKLYRQILLPNGLRAVLVSDTLAMHQPPFGVVYEDDSDDDDHSDDDMHQVSKEDDDDEHDGEESCDEEEEEDGLREAAAAMVVGVGSMYDPPEAQGLAHFTEHMLFMGTQKYPTENAYDAFLSKHGGSDNAYTDLEHTVYHLEIPQEGLFAALDMFAQFFIHPLLLEDAVERELNSIESEFQLSKNSDSCRLQQLMCHTCGRDISQHPFGKFSWGNLESLKEMPEKHKVSIMDELRKFYNQYYYAGNMRLVVIGGYSLDVLERKVVQCFSDVPALPREPSPLQPIHVDKRTWKERYESQMSQNGLPFHSESLGKIFRMVPVQDRHSLSITWQLPSQIPNWRSKPCDCIAHLLGHEAQGSLLSALKEKSWATTCYAGVGSEGLENASSHALFTLTFSLSQEGVSQWTAIVTAVYRYIGMLRQYCASPEGLPEWIHEELRSIHELSYRYGDEPSSDDLVQDLAEELAPHCGMPPERLLDGSELLFDYDPLEIKTLLDDFFRPLNMRLDLMSSLFGRAADFEASESDGMLINGSTDGGNGDSFDLATAGPPNVEPMFGARYWSRLIPQALLTEWDDASTPLLPPPDSMLSLPPKNPFVPERFELKQLPADDSHHPLVHSSLKLCITIGKKKSWFPATVTKYNATKNHILLSYEDEDEKWHSLDQHAHLSSSALSPGFEGTLDNKAIKYRIVALAKDGEGSVLKYGDESDHHVEDGIHFPPIPPAVGDSRLPQLILNTQVLKFWHLQDRKFKRPIAEMRISIICAAANKTPFHRACADLFVSLIHDAVTETSYLASVCELGSSIEATDVGFSIRVHGFDDKLLELFKLIVSDVLSFRGREGESGLPECIREGRFEACLEVMQRKYANHGLKASSLCSDARLRCLLPSKWSPHSKSKALQDIDQATFTVAMSEILGKFAIEGLYHGNVDRSDAELAKNLVLTLIDESGGGGLPKKKYPLEPVTKMLPTEAPSAVILPSRDATEPNTAVEVYFQVGKDSLEERVLIDLLSHMMYEPLYDSVRTKDQFGYQVSCDARWTNGVMGLHFRVVSSTKSAAEITERIDKFLMEYRTELSEMKDEDFMEHLVGLAKNKLDKFSSLSDECDSLWGEIRDGRYEWQSHRNEAVCLRTITKQRVLVAFDEWLSPSDGGKRRKRRMLVVHVIGTSDGPASIGRPVIKESAINDHIDATILAYRKSNGNATWGKIVFSN